MADNNEITDESYHEDYLNLAVIMCKMLTGIMDITTNNIQNISLYNISNEAKQLVVDNILVKKYQKIKTSSFFKTINWTKLEKGLLTPPFKPDIVNIINFYYYII